MSEWMHKKAEALSLLVDQGVSFEEAANLVKVASDRLEKEAGINMTGVVKNIPAMAKSYAGKAAAGIKGASPKAKLGMAAAGGAVVGAAAAKGLQEKKAEALVKLVEQGMEFEKAAAAVEAKAAELEKAAKEKDSAGDKLLRGVGAAAGAVAGYKGLRRVAAVGGLAKGAIRVAKGSSIEEGAHHLVRAIGRGEGAGAVGGAVLGHKLTKKLQDKK